uniref:CBS domain-containing protein n=1 Tax=Lotharella oceanica TaxID=641309 RepID=A0A7S2XC99_9EUKA|mmetsp:Transcript_28363/g.52972  ORF Transcript_28363/g.52972 Transcript_28363/m.52972 type:complete len:340 (+) Transcript_28363:1-1020(+)
MRRYPLAHLVPCQGQNPNKGLGFQRKKANRAANMQQGKEEKHKTTRKVTFFDGKKIKDILEMMTDFNTFLGLNDKLITVPEKATVEEALKEMKARNVTSLPIEGKDGKIKGLVSTLDIVVGVVFAPMYTRYNEEATSKLRLEDLKSITTNKALFESQVANLVGIHEETRTLSEFWDDDDLSLLAHRMSMGVHRALIKPRDKTKKMRIVTQTDFLNYIAQRIVTDPRIAKIMSQTIGKLGLVETTEVVTVKNTDRAVLGFRKLWMGGKWFDWSLSALPIVDAKGELVGNLSGSDMRNMTKDNLDDLLLSVRAETKQDNFFKKEKIRIIALPLPDVNACCA